MENKIKALSVFCGSSLGNDIMYHSTALDLGKQLAAHSIELVYGGAKVGLMGAIADGALSMNGRVVGVIPEYLKNKELAHDGLTEMITVNSMHERKMIMYERSDGAIVLPGGFGTLDEMFELLTWGQMGLHTKPIAILNVGGFYDDLVIFLDGLVDKGFLRSIHRAMLLITEDLDELFHTIRNFEAVSRPKWMDVSGT